MSNHKHCTRHTTDLIQNTVCAIHHTQTDRRTDRPTSNKLEEWCEVLSHALGLNPVGVTVAHPTQEGALQLQGSLIQLHPTHH